MMQYSVIKCIELHLIEEYFQSKAQHCTLRKNGSK